MNDESIDELDLLGLDDDTYQRVKDYQRSSQYDGDSYRLCTQDMLEYSLKGICSINIRD